jgi:hypothetical protein
MAELAKNLQQSVGEPGRVSARRKLMARFIFNLRFRVTRKRALFISLWVAVVGTLTVMAILELSRDRLEQQVVADLESLAGRFQREPLGPRWVSQLPFASYLPQRVTGVEFHGEKITDDTLARLRILAGLRGLSLIGTRVTDDGLAHLESMSELESVYIESEQITDAGLHHLKRLPKLKYLCVPCRGISDSGINELQGARPNLKIDRALHL